MIERIVRRLALSVGIVIFAVSIVFFMMYSVGDPAAAALGERASQAQLDAFRVKHGLDAPLIEQFSAYMGITPCLRKTADTRFCGLLQGDFGYSLRQDQPIARLLSTRIPRTALLSGMALLIEVALGVLLGILAGATRQRWLDSTVLVSAYFATSLPTFVIGLVALDRLAYRAGLFPVGGYGENPWDHVYHALLPALTLALVGCATYVRLVRGEVRDLLAKDFVRTLRALGRSRPAIVWRHLLRLSALPVVTLVGLQLASLVGGAVITETVFGWPGLGRLAVESIYNLDAPMVLAIVVVASCAVQVGNLLADIAIGFLDPTLRDVSA